MHQDHASNYSRYSPVVEMNVVPFIDVMLVLLVIFMVTAPLLTTTLKVDLPLVRSGASHAPQPQHPLIITVNQAGDFYLNRAEQTMQAKPVQAIAPRLLQQYVQQQLQLALASGIGYPAVWVQGDAAVPYAKVMEAVDILRQAGVKQIGLLARPLASQ